LNIIFARPERRDGFYGGFEEPSENKIWLHSASKEGAYGCPRTMQGLEQQIPFLNRSMVWGTSRKRSGTGGTCIPYIPMLSVTVAISHAGSAAR
jgi:hypothetical protein